MTAGCNARAKVTPPPSLPLATTRCCACILAAKGEGQNSSLPLASGWQNDSGVQRKGQSDTPT
ncbi:hypothetical protein GCM10007082_27770 [Oceanisphaera arctica]|nr:hypothetical protein GCM10007082_27770 [Oceanisphaera arctica]